MQGIGLAALVGLLKPGIGIVHGPQAYFLIGETHPETEAILELEGRAQVVVLQRGAGEQSHADTSLDIGFERLTGEFVDQYRAEGQAMVAGRLVTLPVGVAGVPIASEATAVVLTHV